ncbi:hypothetical protein D3C79_846930 [compost metagenome]
MLGYLVVGGEGAAHFPLALNGGQTAPHGPEPVDAIGQRGAEIHGLDVGHVAKVTGVVVGGHLDAEAIVGGRRQSQPPALVERHYEIGIGHPGGGGDVVGARVQGQGAHGGRHPGCALDVDVGANIDEAAGEGRALEAGHGRRVAGEHAGVVGDGGFTGEGATHAGGRLLGQLETGRLDLTRQHQQGDERGLEGGMHSVFLGMNSWFILLFGWGRDFIWYDQ